MSLGQSLEMNIHVISLTDLLKIGGTCLGFIITISKIMEEMTMMARIEMPLREIGITSIEE
jgi:hypothetical protein